jgi:hypothetical protein
MHHACRLLMVMVVARSLSPPQHHHWRGPALLKHHLGTATITIQPLWPHHHSDTKLVALTKK